MLETRASPLVTLFAVLICGSPAAARDYTREVGGWTVIRSDMNCAVWQTYEGAGSTKLSLYYTLESETPAIFVTNDNWSANKGYLYQISYGLLKYKYTITAVGTVLEGQKGFVSKSHPDFLSDFATSHTLTITMGEKTIDRLSLAGSGAAVAEFRRCISLVKADNAQLLRETERQNRLPPGVPRDPFAEQKCEDRLPDKQAVQTNDPSATPESAESNSDTQQIRSGSSMATRPTGGDREFQKLFGDWSTVERQEPRTINTCKIDP